MRTYAETGLVKLSQCTVASRKLSFTEVRTGAIAALYWKFRRTVYIRLNPVASQKAPLEISNEKRQYGELFRLHFCQNYRWNTPVKARVKSFQMGDFGGYDTGGYKLSP